MSKNPLIMNKRPYNTVKIMGTLIANSKNQDDALLAKTQMMHFYLGTEIQFFTVFYLLKVLCS